MRDIAALFNEMYPCAPPRDWTQSDTYHVGEVVNFNGTLYRRTEKENFPYRWEKIHAPQT